ncbi:tRNA 2-selenouridine(34) synthase MnmH [Bacillaceae bacterium]
MKEITPEELLENPNYVVIDVRSPQEYAEATIPGAINVPLFTDDERKEIGTLYKQRGPQEARWRAMELVSPKIPGLMRKIRETAAEGREPVIFCWRGGMRSKAVATLAEMAGLPIVRLTGGYRAYRQSILERLGPELLPGKAVVLHGMTGVGKTQILQRLEKKGYPVLDLEAIAAHRGSVFGAFGVPVPHNQKTFDALLFHQLKRLKEKGHSFFLMEAESKRIGRAVQPDFLLEAKHKGLHIYLQAPLIVRIERTLAEYVYPYQNEPWFKDKIYEALARIEKRLKPETRKAIVQAIEQNEFAKLVELLFLEYYDPRYEHKLEEYDGPFETVDATDLDEAIARIEGILRRHGLV